MIKKHFENILITLRVRAPQRQKFKSKIVYLKCCIFFTKKDTLINLLSIFIINGSFYLWKCIHEMKIKLESEIRHLRPKKDCQKCKNVTCFHLFFFRKIRIIGQYLCKKILFSCKYCEISWSWSPIISPFLMFKWILLINVWTIWHTYILPVL